MRFRRAVVVAFVSTLSVVACSGDDKSSSTTAPVSTIVCSAPVTNSSQGVPDGTISCKGMSQEHTTADVKYPQTPPVGGPHFPVPQPCGYYADPIIEEKGVHSMEHGAVWITYQPTLPADQVATLKAMVNGHPYLLISPFVGLPTPVVASAWGEQLPLPSVSDARLAQFVAFFEQGPQTPEPGAAC